MDKTKKGSSYLARTAAEVKNYRTCKRVIPVIMGVIAVLLVLLYVIAVMYTRFGSFTVSVNKYHQLQHWLSLCESASFNRPTSRLECMASEEITNIDGATLDDLDLGAVDGIDSGDNYLCYTFYCKNTGNETIDFDYSIDIANMTLGVEKAARIRLQTNRNGQDFTRTDYARAAGVDAQGNTLPEPGTVAFFSKYVVMQDSVTSFAPGDMMKFTVVIWLEGPDPDCLDDIIGGQFKVDMKFNVTSTTKPDEAKSV